MPAVTEFAIQLQDRPGVLGKLCRAIAGRGVSIVAFQAFPTEKGRNTLRLVTDNPTATKAVLQAEHANYTEAEVAQSRLPHRPGALAQVSTQLGDANINIDHAYVGIEPGTNAPIVILGVSDVARAARLLDEASTSAA